MWSKWARSQEWLTRSGELDLSDLQMITTFVLKPALVVALEFEECFSSIGHVRGSQALETPCYMP